MEERLRNERRADDTDEVTSRLRISGLNTSVKTNEFASVDIKKQKKSFIIRRDARARIRSRLNTNELVGEKKKTKKQSKKNPNARSREGGERASPRHFF